jgi:cytochrome P450 PksS
MGDPIKLDSPAIVADPFPVYERLRREAPVYRARMRMSYLGDADVYVLSRYRDCVDLVTDERMCRTVEGPEAPWIPKAFQLVTTDSMIVKDRPEHSRLRKLASRTFSRNAIARMADRIDAMTTDLLAGFTAGQRIDLQADYAVPIPFTVLSEMVCAGEADQARFHDVSRMLSALWTPQHGIEQMVAMVEGTAEVVRDMIKRRRAEPVDDVVTVLAHVNENGDALSDDEIVAMVFLLVVADADSTYGLIANGVAALLAHPDQLDLLKTDPDLIDSAVEEILRFTGTIGSTEVLYPREDIELHGVTIPRGARVIPLLASANRDPAVFHNPDTFDITRTPNRHIAFSKGAHFCLGDKLVRMEAAIAITNLISRFPDMQLAVDVTELQMAPAPMLMRRFISLPVVLN